MTSRLSGIALLIFAGLILSSCSNFPISAKQHRAVQPKPNSIERVSVASPFLAKLCDAAIERLNHQVTYDPSYFDLEYPNGDPPADKGVCTDEVIRSFRAVGVDLQQEVHQDMKANFDLYPKTWGMTKTDANIDHRRVPNLMVFFGRKGESLAITNDAKDYSPGEVVAWDLGGGVTHIGIVVNVRSDDKKRYKIVHNIGGGPQLEDRLFDWKVIGHYRYVETVINR